MVVHIVLAGHGEFPKALHSSAEMIVGRIEITREVELRPGVGLEEFMHRLEDVLDDGPTLILTDLRGGTPDNAAQVLARRHPNVHVISNVTLGVLLEVLSWADLDSHSLDQLCQLAAPCVAHRQPA